MKFEKIVNNAYFKTGFALILITVFSAMGFCAAYGYGSVVSGGGASAAPAVVTSINIPLNISPQQAGSASQNFNDGSKIEIEVPKGTVESQTKFELKEGELSSNIKPVKTSGAIMFGGKVFNVEAKNIENKSVNNFSSNIIISLTVPNLPANTSDLGVYYFNETAKEWILVSGATFNAAAGKVTFSVNHLTIFAIFKIAGMPSSIKGEKAASIDVVAEKPKTVAQTKNTPAKSKLAEEKGPFKNGALLKSGDRLYAVTKNKLIPIMTITEYNKYKSKKAVNVSGAALNKMARDKSAKGYANGTLIRGSDYKTYVLKNGKKQYIKSIAELKKYKGRKIYNLPQELVNQY